MNDAQFAVLWGNVTFAAVAIAGHKLAGVAVHAAVIHGAIAAVGWVALQYLILSRYRTTGA
jgi:hypothetical protein